MLIQVQNQTTFALQSLPIDLPVREIIPEVKEQSAALNTLIIQTPPGAGKSTLLPLALVAATWLAGKKRIRREFRRLAARIIVKSITTY